jgi:hypothetical protein
MSTDDPNQRQPASAFFLSDAGTNLLKSVESLRCSRHARQRWSNLYKLSSSRSVPQRQCPMERRMNVPCQPVIKISTVLK